MKIQGLFEMLTNNKRNVYNYLTFWDTVQYVQGSLLDCGA